LLLESGKKGVHSLPPLHATARLRWHERVIGIILRTYDKPLCGQLFFMRHVHASVTILVEDPRT
jgi:hypothetical protein